MPSSTSATSTNSVITRAVKNSPIAAAATIAMLMESSMVIRRATMFSAASLKIGQPPTITPDDAHTRKRLPETKPHHPRGQCDECDAGSLPPLEDMLVVMLIVAVVVAVQLGCRDRCARLAVVGEARPHRRIFKDSHREFLHFR
jgi:hypothetical protein